MPVLLKYTVLQETACTKKTVESSEAVIDCSSFPAGMMIVKLVTDSGCTVTKVIKK